MCWEGDLLKGHLRAVNHKWTIARRPRDVTDSNRTHCLVWDINYHPDGGQVKTRQHFYTSVQEFYLKYCEFLSQYGINAVSP